MKTIFEDGDMVFYEGERCTVRGTHKKVNGKDGVHVSKPNGDIVLAPTSALQTYDTWLLDQCVELLNEYEQWEANLTLDENDAVLESMSAENYDMMIRLQTRRNDIGRALAHRNMEKN